MSKKNSKKGDKETKKKKVTSDNTKKSVKSVKRRKKKTASSIKKVVADKFWKSDKDASGKITKGRKRKKKLSRKEEKNRYQSIVKTISEYYKKAGLNYYICVMKRILICIIAFTIIWYILLSFSRSNSIKTNESTHIEKVIKRHNRVKESISNTKYPTLSKPSNSQSTIMYGDSIRVVKKEIDSVDDYMRYWYEVLDTNSNGEIDDTENK